MGDGNYVVEPAKEAAERDTDLYDELKQTAGRLYDDVAPSVVKVETDSGSGSGFFIDDKGGIITNAHVAETGKEHRVLTNDGTRYSARVEKYDDINDLALLRLDGVSGSPRSPLDLEAKFKNETKAFTVGHPAGLFPARITPGIADRLTDELSLCTVPALIEHKLPPQESPPINYSRDGMRLWKYQSDGSKFETKPPLPLKSRITQEERLKEARPLQVQSVLSELSKYNADDLLGIMNRPALEGRLNLIGGNSGGPIVNEGGDVIGVARTSVGEKLLDGAVPASTVEKFLNSPSKFDFEYRYKPDLGLARTYESYWQEQPFLTATMSTLGVAGTVSAGRAWYKGVSTGAPTKSFTALPLVAGSALAYNDIYAFSTEGGDRHMMKNVAALTSDAAIMAGGALRMTGKYKGVGTALIGAGAATRIGAEFAPTRPYVTDISRADGSSRPPLPASILREVYDAANLKEKAN